MKDINGDNDISVDFTEHDKCVVAECIEHIETGFRLMGVCRDRNWKVIRKILDEAKEYFDVE